PTGVARNIRSASRAARSKLATSSIKPSSRALASEDGLRPTPRILPTTPDARIAAANEPPISPTPTTASTGTVTWVESALASTAVMTGQAHRSGRPENADFLLAGPQRYATTRASHHPLQA